MREKFIPKKFNAKHQQIIDVCSRVMGEYRTQGLNLSLRQLYYQLVANYGLPNEDKNYKMLGSIISDARDAGLLDWDDLVDRGRRARQLINWKGPAEILDWSAEQFRLRAKWENQPNYVEVMVEKQALEGVIIPVTDTYNVHFSANKGYSSSSAMYEAGKRIEAAMEAGKDITIIYLGDHDPSGIDMSRDVENRLKLYSGYNMWYGKDDSGKDDFGFAGRHDNKFDVLRVALNMEQIEEYNPPPNPAKQDDARYAGYVELYGDESWELDALEPAILSGLVEDAILAVMDVEQWNKDIEQENQHKLYLKSLAKTYREKGDTGDTGEDG